MCAALDQNWGWDGSLTEAVHWITRALSRDDGLKHAELDGYYCDLYWALAEFAPQVDRDYARAHWAAKKCVELARRLGETNRAGATSLADSLVIRARAEQFAVSADAARATFAEAAAAAQGSPWDLHVVPLVWSIFEMVEGQLDRAIELARQSLKAAESLGDPYALFQSMHNMGRLSLLKGDSVLARDQLANQVDAAIAVASADHLTEFAEDYGAALAACGEFPCAAHVLGATEADRLRRDAARHPSLGPRIDAPYDEARERVGSDEWARQYQLGLTMTVNEALEASRWDRPSA
jgi:hypothetical protein